MEQIHDPCLAESSSVVDGDRIRHAMMRRVAIGIVKTSPRQSGEDFDAARFEPGGQRLHPRFHAAAGVRRLGAEQHSH